MKRLLILTAAAALTVAMTGCRCCDWLFRGAPAQQYPAPVCAAPCAPACNPCDPCGAPGMVTPGPEAYAPGPTP
jgi:hypothetical protein